MIFRRPPALAKWLLDRLGDAPLAGDLLEEFRNGRSAAWFWRQTLVAAANRIARRGTELRLYLLALGAAFVAQFAVTVTLWSKNSPPALHVSAWMRFWVWLAIQFGYATYERLVNRMVVGTSSPVLTRMYCAAAGGRPKLTIASLAAWQSFSLGLACYGLCALVLPRLSLPWLVLAEVYWFGAFIAAPALVSLSAPSAEKVEHDQQTFAFPQSEPVLTVILPGNTSITLQRETLAQSVFAAADRDLIEVVFGRGRGLDLLRRAIWLGSCRTAGSVTLAELGTLIDEATHTTSVIEAIRRPNMREAFLLRLKLWFCGDSA